jgi:hypothetical protein
MLFMFSLCSYLQQRAAKDKSFTYEVPLVLNSAGLSDLFHS